MSFWFGEFELDQERRQLLRSGEPVPLEPKAYELLSLLVERRPRALSRAQIRDVIWPGTYVSESTLAVVVNGIRHALGDDARQPRFVRTVHGFGYAFCGEVREVAEERPGAKEAVERLPYPGLLAFTEADAEYFFGREAEVEALWEKVRRQRVLAVIGPSGVGKTSFLRAGVLPGRPPRWVVAYATPGASPALALARALIPGLAGDSVVIGELLQGVQELSLSGESDRVLAAVGSWRKKSSEALVAVDQFEELFALNAPEVQARYAALLGRLAEEADVHVLLSLRDDFLFRCSEQDSLRPVFHDLTPLAPPSSGALRRALAEPARREGYRFEDDALVDEMVEAVASERGALPLLAFAVSRLWEERDRSRKLLTREAYGRIEGVAGALAQHAEATLARLGPEREGMVREIFRNLVTAQGTRAVADRAELLSVFGEKQEEAEVVLDALVAARLLTEYEAADAHAGQVRPKAPRGEGPASSGGEAGHRCIEIVHESLLTHWPRLLRWRTQDADGAQLRDQLRQAAHLWEERGRPEDLLWTGTSFLDFRAWRARYQGGLSVLEEEFARAMTALAGRRRRRRRAAVTAALAALAVGLGVVGVLWTWSEAHRRRADAEAVRAEAGKLVALGQMELERYPTAALAYATKSLELADTEEARRLALRVLQGGPTALVDAVAPGTSMRAVAFSPDGKWLVESGVRGTRLLRRDGRPVATLEEAPSSSLSSYAYDPESRLLLGSRSGRVGVWSVPDGREVRRLEIGPGASSLFVRGHGFFASTTVGDREVVRWAALAGPDSHLVGAMDAVAVKDIDAAGTWMAYVPGSDASSRTLYLRSLRDWAQAPRVIATHPAGILSVAFHPDGRRLAAGDRSGRIRIWATDGASERPLRTLDCAGLIDLAYSPRGRWLAAVRAADFRLYVQLWDLTAPPSTGPLRFPIEIALMGAWSFDPSEQWLATLCLHGIALWPLGGTYPRSVGRHEWPADNVAFTPDGSTLVSAAGGSDGTVRARSVSPGDPGDERILLRTTLNGPGLAVDPAGRRVAVSSMGRVLVLPLVGGPARELEGFSGDTFTFTVALAFSPDGRRVVTAGAYGAPEDHVVRVWDIESGEGRVLGPLPGAGEIDVGGVGGLAFVDDDHIVTCGFTSGLLLVDLRDGQHTVLSSRPAHALAVDHRGRVVLAVVGEPEPNELIRVGLDGQAAARVFPCPGCRSVALDPTGTVVATGSDEGIVRMGPASGGEPHLFFGRALATWQIVAFSPDGRWVASSGEQPGVRLWPVPDVARTPLHRRRHDELLATLRSWTNLRAVKDPQSPTGWRLEPDPFPGWAKLPEW